MPHSMPDHEKVLAVLAEKTAPGERPDWLIAAQKGVYHGVIALFPDRAVFVRDRFGTLEWEAEAVYAKATDLSKRKGLTGHEVRFHLERDEWRLSHLSEEDAAELEDRLSGPDSADVAEATPPAPSSSVEAATAGQHEMPQKMGPPPPPDREAAAAVPAPVKKRPPKPPGKKTDRRAFTIDPKVLAELAQALATTPELGPEAERLNAAFDRIKGPAPSAEAAARIFLESEADPENHPIRENPHSKRILRPALRLLATPHGPVRFKMLAASAFETFADASHVAFLLECIATEEHLGAFRSMVRALAAIEDPSALSALLRLAVTEEAPRNSEVFEVLADTRWVQAVPVMASAVDIDDEGAAPLMSACARMLRLPPARSEDLHGAQPLKDAFLDFLHDHGAEDPVASVRASVEQNLDALFQADTALLPVISENLRKLTCGGKGPEGRQAAHHWKEWWTRNGGGDPDRWMHPDLRRVLAISLADTGKALEQDTRRLTGEKTKKEPDPENLGLSHGGVFLRALVCGLLAGAAWYFAIEYDDPIDVGHFWRAVIIWGAVGMSGPILLLSPKRFLRMAPFALAAVLVMYIAHDKPDEFEFEKAEYLVWAVLSAGALFARKNEAFFIAGPILAAIIFFGGRLIPMAAFDWDEDGVLATLITVTFLFWWLHMVPDVKPDPALADDGEAKTEA